MIGATSGAVCTLPYQLVPVPRAALRTIDCDRQEANRPDEH